LKRDERSTVVLSTHPSTVTPVAIFCIERVPRLDGLLMRYVLSSFFAWLGTCAGPAGVTKRKPSSCRRQRSQRCGLSTGVFFRRGLAHWCKGVRLVDVRIGLLEQLAVRGLSGIEMNF
jgi:hypothetical protein